MNTTKVTTMTEAEIQSATAALVELRRQMTFVLPMTSTERTGMRKLGKRAVQAAQMRAAVAREHQDALPPSFDLPAFEREVGLLTALEACLTAANQIQADLRDTFQIIGTGALQTSKLAYGYIQVQAESGGNLQRTVRHLKLRTRKAKPETASPVPIAGAAKSGTSNAPTASSGTPKPETPAIQAPQPSIVPFQAEGGASDTNKVA